MIQDFAHGERVAWQILEDGLLSCQRVRTITCSEFSGV